MGYECEKAFEEVFEGGEPVHPAAPEVREGLVGNDDAAEGDDEEEEYRYQQRSKEFVGGESGKILAMLMLDGVLDKENLRGNRLTETNVEQLK